MKKLILSGCLVAAMCLPALAGTNYNVCFNALDADGDGVMSKSEFLVAFADGDVQVFTTADADKDGGVSHEEWEEFKASKGYEEGDHHG